MCCILKCRLQCFELLHVIPNAGYDEKKENSGLNLEKSPSAFHIQNFFLHLTVNDKILGCFRKVKFTTDLKVILTERQDFKFL